jgi:hypothetical protein
MAGGGADFNRNKEWLTNSEILTNEDLNNELNHFLSNLDAGGIGDHSDDVATMRQTTSPGASGTESLATDVAGEIERLRYCINRIVGETYWYEAPDLSLDEAADLFTSALSLPPSRIISGRIRSAATGQPLFLKAAASSTVTLKAGSGEPNFVAQIDGAQYTVTGDVSKANLSLAPSTNNTALVNDSTAADGDATKVLGENGTYITIDNVGTEISNLVGKIAAFSINNGSATEYFLAYVESATRLSKCLRGYFFDSSDAPVDRIAFADNDTITLMRLTWVFLKSDGTLDVTYNNPYYAYDTPSSPSSGDYWFDLDNRTWKKYDGSAFASANAVLIGYAIQDSSGCVGTRSFEFFAGYSDLNTATLERESASAVRTSQRGAKISVAGETFDFYGAVLKWDMSADLDTGTEQASKTYYLYLTCNGDEVLSLTPPYDRRHDLLGLYHPHALWRCLGSIFNDSSSDFATRVNYPVVTTDGSNPGLGGLSSSADVNNVSTTSGTMSDVTSVTLTSSGWPVLIMLASADTATPSTLGGLGATQFAQSFLLRRTTSGSTSDIARWGISCGNSASNAIISVPPSAVWHIDTPPAGVHTYTFQYASGLNDGVFSIVAGPTSRVNNAKAVAIEMVGGKLFL